MIEQTLTVVALDGTTAHLEAQQKKACEGCNGRCGSQVFAKLFGSDKKTILDVEHHKYNYRKS